MILSTDVFAPCLQRAPKQNFSNGKEQKENMTHIIVGPTLNCSSATRPELLETQHFALLFVLLCYVQ